MKRFAPGILHACVGSLIAWGVLHAVGFRVAYRPRQFEPVKIVATGTVKVIPQKLWDSVTIVPGTQQTELTAYLPTDDPGQMTTYFPDR
jgi:hypothetical protein